MVKFLGWKQDFYPAHFEAKFFILVIQKCLVLSPQLEKRQNCQNNFFKNDWKISLQSSTDQKHNLYLEFCVLLEKFHTILMVKR